MRWIAPGDPLRPAAGPPPVAGQVCPDELTWHNLPSGEWLGISSRTGGWAVFDGAERAALLTINTTQPTDRYRRIVAAAWQRALVTIDGRSAYDADEQADAITDTRDYYTLVLLLNSGCNLACSYCYLGHATPTRDRALESGHARTAVLAALDQPWPTILIDFGEISAARQRFQILLPWAEQQAKDRGKWLRASIQTNATTIDDELADFLAAHDVSAGISLDGPRAIHDSARRFRNGSGSYDRTVAAIDRCRDRGVRVHLIATVTQRSVSHPADVFYELARHEPDSFLLKPVLRQGEAATAWDSEGVTADEFGEFMRRTVTLADNVDVNLLDQSARKFLLRLLGDRGGWRDSCTSRYCGSGRSLHVVGADGGLHACPRFVTDDKPVEPPLLRITTRPSAMLYDLLPTALRHAPATCTGCSWLGSCGGGCTLAGQGDSRSAPLPDPNCDSYYAIHSALCRTVIPSFLNGRHQVSRVFNGATMSEVMS